MAYKFQRGVAIISGSILVDDDLSVSGSVALPAGSTAISQLDIDGGVDIGAALADGDLIIVDDGAGGTNRKSAVSRIPTYLVDHTSLTSLTSLVGVGALNAGSISSGFGHIDNGASNITNGGLVKLDVDADASDLTGDSATGRLTIGAGEDLNLYHGGDHSYIVNNTGDLKLETAGGFLFSKAGASVGTLDDSGLDLASGDAYQIVIRAVKYYAS